MKNYKVISLDMFQTLANVQSREEYIWKRILKADYSEELKNKYVMLAGRKIVEHFHSTASCASEFRTLKEIFYDNFKEIFQETALECCPEEAMMIFVEEHGYSEIYKDSIEFVKRACQKYNVCLVSDADIEMVEPILKQFDFDKVFISEFARSYKRDPQNKIFQDVIGHYKVDPNTILHIGDSSSDMYGATKAGIDVCWINRHEYTKRFDFEPNYSIKSLEELYSVLDI